MSIYSPTMTEAITIRLARDRADFDSCVLLQRAVWGLGDLEITSAIQLVATTHAGGLVHLAEAPDGRPIGFAYAFPGIRDGVPHLHSDLLGVLPEYQRRGVGLRLKWAQREDALARGVTFVTWTFDPLQARNAHLNLRRLGAAATEFLENFYGVTTASLHHGLPTDRLLVRWELKSSRVTERAAQGEPPRTVAAVPYPRINEVKWQAGWPVSSEPRLDLDAPELALEIPPEWDILCQAAPRVAEGWHTKVRRALTTYFGRGYVADDFAPTEEGGRRRPLYVLRKT
jgi:predicted GNAT superfamily acetyltransferase